MAFTPPRLRGSPGTSGEAHSVSRRTPIISPVLNCEFNGELLEPPEFRLDPLSDSEEERSEASDAPTRTQSQLLKAKQKSNFRRQMHRHWWNCCYRKEVAADAAWWLLTLPNGIARRWPLLLSSALLQPACFLAFVFLSANDPIVKELSKRPLEPEGGGPLALLQQLLGVSRGKIDFPYAMSSVLLVSNAISVVAGSLTALLCEGTAGLRRCWNLRSILKMAPISALFSYASYLKFMSLKYLPPDLVAMLSQMNLVMLAVVMRFVLGKRYRNSQWVSLGMTSLLMLQYVSLRDGGVGSPVELSADTVTGILLIVLMCLAETVASVFAEKYFKERQQPFHIQKVHVDSTAMAFAWLSCYVLEPFVFQHWSRSPARCRQVYDRGLFDGWDRSTVLVLACLVAKFWLGGLVSRVLDSLVKQLGSCAATALTYAEVAWLYPERNSLNFQSALALSAVLMSIASFATSTRDSLTICRLKAEVEAHELGRKEVQSSGDDDSWVQAYQAAGRPEWWGRRTLPTRTAPRHSRSPTRRGRTFLEFSQSGALEAAPPPPRRSDDDDDSEISTASSVCSTPGTTNSWPDESYGA